MIDILCARKKKILFFNLCYVVQRDRIIQFCFHNDWQTMNRGCECGCGWGWVWGWGWGLREDPHPPTLTLTLQIPIYSPNTENEFLESILCVLKETHDPQIGNEQNSRSQSVKWLEVCHSIVTLLKCLESCDYRTDWN